MAVEVHRMQRERDAEPHELAFRPFRRFRKQRCGVRIGARRSTSAAGSPSEPNSCVAGRHRWPTHRAGKAIDASGVEPSEPRFLTDVNRTLARFRVAGLAILLL